VASWAAVVGSADVPCWAGSADAADAAACVLFTIECSETLPPLAAMAS
jgi:hypothetical protein